MDYDTCNQLEADARRPITGDVWHPDQCETVTLHGVTWSVRPLIPPKGIRFTPTFGKTVELDVKVNEGEADRALLELAGRITETAPVTETAVCDKCGRPEGGELEVDIERDTTFLCSLVDYAAQNLRKQYELTDADLGKLLAFDGDGLPKWVTQFLRHANQLPTEPPTVEAVAKGAFPDLNDFLEPENAPEQENSKKPRRKWWGK